MQYTLRDLLNVVFRYSRALVIFWVVTLIAILIFYSQTAKVYDSKARILVTLGSEAQGRADYINGKNLQVVQREQQLHDEQQILQSHDVLITAAKWIAGDPVEGAPPPVTSEELDQARRYYTGKAPAPTLLLRASEGITRLLKKVSKPKSHEEDLEELAKQLFDSLSVNAIFDSDALDIAYRYRDPHVAQTVLRLILAAYYNHHIAIFQSSAESNLLKAQMDQSVDQFHDRLGQLSDFKNAHKVYNDEFQSNALIEERGKIEQALSESKADADSARARLATLKSLDATLQQYETYSTSTVPNKYRDTLTQKLGESKVEEEALLNRHPVGSRAYEEQQSQIDELQRLIDKEPQQLPGGTEMRRRKASELVESEIISATETLRGNEARADHLGQDKNRIDSELTRYTNNLQGFGALQLDLAFAKRQSEQMEQAFVDSQLRTLTSENAITDVSIIDLPSLELRAASPKPSMIAAAGAGLLLMGSFAVILACAGLDSTVNDARSAELRLGAPVSASIPLMPTELSSQSEFANSFTRENHREFARIYQITKKETPDGKRGKVVLLTESTSGEGCSMVAYGLARFLSRDVHENAAFIDCSANSILKPSAVSKESEKEPTLVAWPKDSVGADGTLTTAASAIAKLREQYGYVVIAGGALKDATSVLTIAGIASATFLIVEAEKTRRASARYSLDLLQTYGFKGAGIILNKRVFYVPAWLMRFV